MAEIDDGLPEFQIGRAPSLADGFALCGQENISALDLLDALATIGLTGLT